MSFPPLQVQAEFPLNLIPDLQGQSIHPAPDSNCHTRPTRTSYSHSRRKRHHQHQLRSQSPDDERFDERLRDQLEHHHRLDFDSPPQSHNNTPSSPLSFEQAPAPVSKQRQRKVTYQSISDAQSLSATISAPTITTITTSSAAATSTTTTTTTNPPPPTTHSNKNAEPLSKSSGRRRGSHRHRRRSKPALSNPDPPPPPPSPRFHSPPRPARRTARPHRELRLEQIAIWGDAAALSPSRPSHLRSMPSLPTIPSLSPTAAAPAATTSHHLSASFCHSPSLSSFPSSQSRQQLLPGTTSSTGFPTRSPVVPIHPTTDDDDNNNISTYYQQHHLYPHRPVSSPPTASQPPSQSQPRAQPQPGVTDDLYPGTADRAAVAAATAAPPLALCHTSSAKAFRHAGAAAAKAAAAARPSRRTVSASPLTLHKNMSSVSSSTAHARSTRSLSTIPAPGSASAHSLNRSYESAVHQDQGRSFRVRNTRFNRGKSREASYIEPALEEDKIDSAQSSWRWSAGTHLTSNTTTTATTMTTNTTVPHTSSQQAPNKATAPKRSVGSSRRSLRLSMSGSLRLLRLKGGSGGHDQNNQNDQNISANNQNGAGNNDNAVPQGTSIEDIDEFPAWADPCAEDDVYSGSSRLVLSSRSMLSLSGKKFWLEAVEVGADGKSRGGSRSRGNRFNRRTRGHGRRGYAFLTSGSSGFEADRCDPQSNSIRVGGEGSLTAEQMRNHMRAKSPIRMSRLRRSAHRRRSSRLSGGSFFDDDVGGLDTVANQAALEKCRETAAMRERDENAFRTANAKLPQREPLSRGHVGVGLDNPDGLFVGLESGAAAVGPRLAGRRGVMMASVGRYSRTSTMPLPRMAEVQVV